MPALHLLKFKAPQQGFCYIAGRFFEDFLTSF